MLSIKRKGTPMDDAKIHPSFLTIDVWWNPCYTTATPVYIPLTHWGRVTHICVSKLTNIGSANGLSPGRRQAIIWTNDGILLIWTLGTNFVEVLSEFHAYSFKKMYFKMSSAKWRPFSLGLNVLNIHTVCCTFCWVYIYNPSCGLFINIL